MTKACQTLPDRPTLANVPLPVLETLMILAWSSGFVGMRFSLPVTGLNRDNRRRVSLDARDEICHGTQ